MFVRADLCTHVGVCTVSARVDKCTWCCVHDFMCVSV